VAETLQLLAIFQLTSCLCDHAIFEPSQLGLGSPECSKLCSLNMQPSSQAQLKISKHSASEGTEKIPQLNHKHSGFRCHKRHHKRDRGLDPVSNHVLLQMGQTITSFLLSALGPTSAIRNAMSRLLSKMPAKIVTFPASGRPCRALETIKISNN